MPSFLLDTNVISEAVKDLPEPKVLAWLSAQALSDLHLSAVSLGELVRGVARLPDGRRRERLEQWVSQHLPREFAGRVLPLDHEAAVIWGEMMGEGDRMGRPRAAVDAQIAAIARRNDLVLVTRNVTDFRDLEVQLLNPWS